MHKKIMLLLGLLASLLSAAGCSAGTSSENHTHSYSEATCTKAATCECGATKGTALGHELINGTCSVCGETPEYKVGNFIVLGDSISTFKGYIPLGNDSYYPANSVENAEQTWWSIFADNTKGNLLVNESYSGSTICYTGYDGQQVSKTSFIKRFESLKRKGYFEEEIDTVIIFGGTNDSWAGSPVGEEMYSDWKEEDKLSFLPAFCYLLYSIQKQLPKARIVCIINQNLSGEITLGMKNVCEKKEISYVELSGIEEDGFHPTSTGMIKIEKQLRRVFEQESEKE